MQNSGTPQAAARRFFIRALRACTIPAEVTTDRAPAYLRVLDELIPSALHTVERYANNPGRDRSRTAESSPPAKARPEAPPFRTDPGRRACLRPEPPPRPLRTRHRRPRPPPDPRSIRPAHDGHLTADHSRQRALSCTPIGQRNTARAGGSCSSRSRPVRPGMKAHYWLN
jgi:hypothetical protein